MPAKKQPEEPQATDQSFQPQPVKWHIVPFSLIILASALLLGLLWYQKAHYPSAAVTSTPATSPSNSTTQPQNLPQKPQDAQHDGTDVPTQNPAPSTAHGNAAPPTLSVSIVRGSQLGPNQPVNVRANVTGTTSGTCEVTFRKSGQQDVVRSFAIVMDATTATCGAADVPASAFPVAGDWQLSVVAKSGSAASAAAVATSTVLK